MDSSFCQYLCGDSLRRTRQTTVGAILVDCMRLLPCIFGRPKKFYM